MKQKLTKQNQSSVFETLRAAVERFGDLSIEWKKYTKPRSNPQNATWWKWMTETAQAMSHNGITMPLCIDKDGNPFGERRFTAQDAHELFVMAYLGADHKGDRVSSAKIDSACYSDMMQRHVVWCTERGIKLTIPEDLAFDYSERGC